MSNCVAEHDLHLISAPCEQKEEQSRLLTERTGYQSARANRTLCDTFGFLEKSLGTEHTGSQLTRAYRTLCEFAFAFEPPKDEKSRNSPAGLSLCFHGSLMLHLFDSFTSNIPKGTFQMRKALGTLTFQWCFAPSRFSGAFRMEASSSNNSGRQTDSHTHTCTQGCICTSSTHLYVCLSAYHPLLYTLSKCSCSNGAFCMWLP